MDETNKKLKEWLGEDNNIGIDIWHNKYQYNNETFDEWLDRVSNGDAELRQLIKERKFLFGGRTLANRGVPNNKNYFNCFSAGFIPDDYSAIMDKLKEVGITFKTEGGQGVSMSKLRPKGAPIGEYYQSDGIVPFIEMFNCVTQGTSQGGSRKGALMISLDVRHKEAMDFINLKTDLDAITKANLSLEIDDEFMEAVKAYYLDGKTITLHEHRQYSGHVVEYDIIPINIYKRIMEVVWDYGEPGCIFTDKFRNYNFLEYDESYQIDTCNPCVVGSTSILTDKGYVPIKDLVGQKVNVWNGEEWSTVTPQKTGSDQDLLCVRTSYGREIICTPYHKFILSDGTKIVANELKPNDILATCNYPVIEGETILSNPYTQGFFSGDEFNGSDRRENSDVRETYRVNVEHERDFVPDARYKIADRLDWLAGLIDSDGTIANKSIQITSINNEFIKRVAAMLETLGVYSVINISKHAEKKYFGDGMDNKVYNCQILYRLNIALSDVFTLRTLGLHTQRVDIEGVTVNRSAKRLPRVKQIVDVNYKADVYCFTEPKRHRGVFNGILTGQCGEQPLKSQACCNLGSLNLYEFVENPFTPRATFNFKSFADAIRIASKALDDIIDENASRLPKEMSAYANNAKDWRNIGLGVFGYADALIALRLKYGSTNAIKFTELLFQNMMEKAIQFNQDRCALHGYYPKCNMELIRQSAIYQAHSKLASLNVGFRNCSLLSIAPTGSIGTMMGLSGGIEPEFALCYTRRTDNLKDEYKIEAKVIKDYRKITRNSGELPDYFVASADIPWKNRIDTQATIQNHIDTAISSTINLPKETTREEIEDLYLYAWEQGLKGVTIFRDGCKRTGILTTSDNNDDSTNDNALIGFNRGDIVNVTDDLVGYKRKIVNGCGDFQEQIFFDDFTGEPIENYIAMGDGGGCERNAEAISRLVSLCWRGGIDVSEVVAQLKKVRTCPAYRTRTLLKGDTSKGTSCPSAIGFAIEELCNKINERLFDNMEPEYEDYSESRDDADEFKNEEMQSPKIIVPKMTESDRFTTKPMPNINEPTCPECGEKLIFEGGCNICKSCGWSKCD